MKRLLSVCIFFCCLFLVNKRDIHSSEVPHNLLSFKHYRDICFQPEFLHPDTDTVRLWPKKKKPVKGDGDKKGKKKGSKKPPKPKAPPKGKGPRNWIPRGTILEDWGPVGKDQIFDLNGKLPTDQSVRQAIKDTIDYIISKQNSNGSWDVTLTGKSPLVQTADEALDAVVITSMCGLGLRRHVDLDPRIPKVTQKAARFVMQRVFRGRLSNAVQYAVWRYTLGLKFVTEEYNAVATDRKQKEYAEELDLLASKMLQTLVKMQYINGKPKEFLLNNRRFSGSVTEAQRAVARPEFLGIIVDLPTDKDYRGGARVQSVVANSPADNNKKSPRKGDRIVKLNGTRIENAYDYYNEANKLLGLQKAIIEYKRVKDPSKSSRATRMTAHILLTPKWPGDLGFIVEDTSSGVIIKDFAIDNSLTASNNTRISVGDTIFKINKHTINGIDNYNSFISTLKVGDKLDVHFKSNGSKKKTRLVAVPVSPAGIYLEPVEEDKSKKNGFVIDRVDEGLWKAGIMPGDRVLKLNGIELLGIDHFNMTLATLPGNVEVSMTVSRRPLLVPNNPNKAPKYGPEKIVTVKFTPKPKVFGSQLDIAWETSSNLAIVGSLIKDGAAEKAGFRVGDKIVDMEFKGKSPFYDLFKERYHGGKVPKKYSMPLQKTDVGNVLASGFYRLKLDDKGNPKIEDNQSSWERVFIEAGSQVTFYVYRLASANDGTYEMESDGKTPKIYKLKVQKTSKMGSKGPVFEEGGWNYYHKGAATSFVTAAVLIAFDDAKHLPSIKRLYKDENVTSTIRAARNLLNSMNLFDKKNEDKTKVKTYVYHHATASMLNIHGNMGRISVCEYSMFRTRNKKDTNHTETDLTNALKLWLKLRHEVDIVRNFSWTHHYDYYANAAYYWFFSHYYSAVASHALTDSELKNELQSKILKALMLKRLKNGRWLGHKDFGELCGTAQALMVFGELNGAFRLPTDQEKDKGY